jgi:hypothetical protein
MLGLMDTSNTKPVKVTTYQDYKAILFQISASGTTLLLASQMAERPEGSASVAHINTSQLISQK